MSHSTHGDGSLRAEEGVNEASLEPEPTTAHDGLDGAPPQGSPQTEESPAGPVDLHRPAAPGPGQQQAVGEG